MMPMNELPTDQFEQIRPLFAPLHHHLAIESILNGTTPGKVYVDDLLTPTVGLAWYQSRFYLSGQPETAVSQLLHRLFAETIYPSGLEAMVLHYAPAEWETQATTLFGEKTPIHALRHHYQTQTSPRTCHVPDGFTLRLVDANLLTEPLDHLDILMNEMQSERPFVADFLQHSFGVCLQHGSELVGWCLSEYNTAEQCEVGIEVREPYQKRGFATLLTHALVNEAYRRGIQQVGWHCWARNTASVATALKAGLVKTADCPVYFLSLTSA